MYRERLVQQVELEMPSVLSSGNLERAQELVSLLHLAETYPETPNKHSSSDFTSNNITALLNDLYNSDNLKYRDKYIAVSSHLPVVFLVSYPRSGNTLLLNSLSSSLNAQSLVALRGGGLLFSKALYSSNYPSIRVIKDHVARDYYINDKCIFLIRDGRDIVASLGHMTLMRELHKYEKINELPNLINWLAKKYPFGGWADHMKNVCHLLAGEDKLVLKYNDLVSDVKSLGKAISFVDPGNELPYHFVQKCYNDKDSILSKIKSNRRDKELWGIDAEFDSDSLYYEWSMNRKGSHWSQSWDEKAAKAFHETGATEYLIEFGFETDSQWWKGPF